MENRLKAIVRAQKSGKAVGIYSCCSANEYVIKAALIKGMENHSCVLIESTANQCNQYGGYTGMKPQDFKVFVHKLADEIGFDKSMLFLGGDHLGPLTFADKPEEEAMAKAEELIRQYVAAGFSKIHIDTSMKVGDDDPDIRLSDEIIAARGARLALIAEETYKQLLTEDPSAVEPVYIIGSEVPIPGGQQGTCSNEIEVTKPEDFKATLAAFEKSFREKGLEHGWNNVIGVVVQPGLEEKDSGCTEYDRAKARDLCAAIREYDNIVFEGHSTDYQTRIKLRELIEDGVAILKVGPALTFKMREALFALAFAEREIYDDKASNFMEILDKAMCEDPKYWRKYYQGTEKEVLLKRKYSFSDRSRYYMPLKEVTHARQQMLEHFHNGVPLNLLSQFMPNQYTRVREGLIPNEPEALIIDHIGETIDEYLYATEQHKLY